MSRQVKFGEQELRLNLTGATTFFALKQSVHIKVNVPLLEKEERSGYPCLLRFLL